MEKVWVLYSDRRGEWKRSPRGMEDFTLMISAMGDTVWDIDPLEGGWDTISDLARWLSHEKKQTNSVGTAVGTK